MISLSKKWLSTLTVAERAAWEEYAQEKGSAKGDDTQVSRGSICTPLGRLMSGKNAYIGLNAQLARSDIAAIAAAPLGINAPGNPTGLSLSFTGGATPKITATWTDPTDLEAGGKVSLWGICPGVFHRQIAATFDKAVQTADIEQMRGAGGVSLPLAIGVYRFQLVAWDTHGQRSPGGAVVEINVTTLSA
jgi:hypothetical protein